MSKCDGLSKYKSYDLGFVKHDEAQDAYIVQLVNPPAECKDGIFVTHKGKLVVDSHASNASLTYTTQPVITVRNEAQVQVVNPESHFFLYFFLAVLAAGGIYLLYRFIKSLSTNTTQDDYVYTHNYNAPSASVPVYASGSTTPVAPGPTTVVVNQGNNNDGFVAGMVVGNMLSGGNHSTHTERVVERTTIIEHDAPSRDDSFSGDDDTYSSDAGDSSYSSDSDDSYSSDSSSDSFGSDSSSDSFGSDSSSDSGSFGSDD